MNALKPRDLWFWHVAGDVVMKLAYGRPIPLEAEHLEYTRGLLRAHARAAREAGDEAADRLFTEKWADLGFAMDAREGWLRITGRAA